MLIEKVPAAIPEDARNAHAGAIVQLDITVGKAGDVIEVSPSAVRQPLPEGVLDPLMDAVRQWRYRPTKLNGRPVEVRSMVEIEIRRAS